MGSEVLLEQVQLGSEVLLEQVQLGSEVLLEQVQINFSFRKKFCLIPSFRYCIKTDRGRVAQSV